VQFQDDQLVSGPADDRPRHVQCPLRAAGPVPANGGTAHQHRPDSRTVTDVCCESSARDASTLGYRVIMVADANAARRDQDRNATLYTIYRTFGDVRSAADVIKMIQRS
jgi:Isochorismatase family